MAANYGIKFSELASPSAPISFDLRLPSVELIEGKNYLIKIKDILGLIDKAELQLDKVDNTPDLQKPVSAAVEQALSTKADTIHRHSFGDIDGLEEYLSNNLTNHTHPMTAINGLLEALAGKSDVDHGHQASEIVGLVDLLAGKANVNHSHSFSDINGAVETIQSLWAAVNSKADRVHNHMVSDITDFDQAVKLVIASELDNIVVVDVGHMEW